MHESSAMKIWRAGDSATNDLTIAKMAICDLKQPNSC